MEIETQRQQNIIQKMKDESICLEQKNKILEQKIIQLKD